MKSFVHVKSYSFVLVVLAVMLALSACSSSKEANKDASESAKVLRIGTMPGAAPFIYQDESTGEMKGNEVALLKAVADKLGYTIEWEITEFSGLFGMLDTDRLDTIALMITVTEERKKKYLFTDPYAFTKMSIVQRSDSSYNTLEDLRGKKVGVLTGNSLHDYILNWNKKNGEAITVVPYQDAPVLYSEVQAGRVEGFITDEVGAISEIKTKGFSNLKVADKPLPDLDTESAYPFVRNEENEQFVKEFNAVLKELQEDGTLSKISLEEIGTDISKRSSDN